MKHAQLLSEVSGRFWAMKRSVLERMLVAIRTGGDMPEEALAAARSARASGGAGGGVAVIPVQGVIMHRDSFFLRIFGGTSIEQFRMMFRMALADDAVGAIVLDVDSPGGMVDGTPEMAKEIRAARGGKKPIVASVNTLMASAAYWLGSQCDYVMASPSSECGSVGVFSEHDDMSKMLEQEGVKITFISAGEGKVDGNPYEPLSDAARADIQKRINDIYGDFVAAVAGGRKVSRDQIRDQWQAKVYGARDAVTMGLADELGTLEDAIAKAIGLKNGGKSMSAPNSRTLAGVVPHNTSEELAPKDTPWSKPTLSDFTDKAWNDLSDTDKRRIAGHFAWAKEMPPASFGDLELPHHRASDGKVVFKGVSAAAGRLDQADIPSADKPAVKAHLRHHYDQFKEDPPDSLSATPDELHRSLQLFTEADATIGKITLTKDQPSGRPRLVGEWPPRTSFTIELLRDATSQGSDWPLRIVGADQIVIELANGRATYHATAKDLRGAIVADLADWRITKAQEADEADDYCSCHVECACMNGGKCGMNCETCRSTCACVRADDADGDSDSATVASAAEIDTIDAEIAIAERR